MQRGSRFVRVGGPARASRTARLLGGVYVISAIVLGRRALPE